jgi:hypothetical protein
MGMSEKKAAPAVEPYLQLVEQYASAFERPELRLRFLNRTLARQNEREQRWRQKLRRVAFLQQSRGFRWVLDFVLYRTIFEELQQLLPNGFLERRRIWRQAPWGARLIYHAYRARHYLYVVGAVAGVVLLGALFLIGRYTVRRAQSYLAARTAPAAPLTVPASASAPGAATTAYLPDYRPEKVWLVEQTAEFERYSNGGRILTRYEMQNHPRYYLRYSRQEGEGKTVASEPAVGHEPVGIVYHSSESDIVPFTADNTRSMQMITRDLIAFIRLRHSYNYLIDRFGEIYRIVRDDQAAAHSGHSLWADDEFVYVGLNESFIGICFESSSVSGPLNEQLTEAQIVSGRALTGILRSKYQLRDVNCTTHGLVSVDPARGTIAHHHDWVRNFPFAAFSLSDKYKTLPPSVALYGFGTDDEVMTKLGGQTWAGALAAEEEFKRRAAGEHLAPEELRRRGIERYRAQMEKARVRRAQAQGIQTTPAVETPAGVATSPAQ